MEFRITPNQTKTVTKSIAATKLFVFGFESNLIGLLVAFENDSGGIDKFEIPDTRLGFAIESTEGYERMWFECQSSDKVYFITVNFE
jgi:hypothetical protein